MDKKSKHAKTYKLIITNLRIVRWTSKFIRTEIHN